MVAQQRQKLTGNSYCLWNWFEIPIDLQVSDDETPAIEVSSPILCQVSPSSDTDSYAGSSTDFTPVLVDRVSEFDSETSVKRLDVRKLRRTPYCKDKKTNSYQ